MGGSYGPRGDQSERSPGRPIVWIDRMKEPPYKSIVFNDLDGPKGE